MMWAEQGGSVSRIAPTCRQPKSFRLIEPCGSSRNLIEIECREPYAAYSALWQSARLSWCYWFTRITWGWYPPGRAFARCRQQLKSIAANIVSPVKSISVWNISVWRLFYQLPQAKNLFCETALIRVAFSKAKIYGPPSWKRAKWHLISWCRGALRNAGEQWKSLFLSQSSSTNYPLTAMKPNSTPIGKKATETAFREGRPKSKRGCITCK